MSSPSLLRTVAFVTLFSLGLAHAQVRAQGGNAPTLPLQAIARAHFGNDAPWFLRNIPFLEIDDPAIERVYYYRWMLYRSHIRQIGQQGTTVLEFLGDVPWAREPYTDLNDSASFHLMEGRWLRDPTTVDDLITHLYAGAGNDRHFSESIAAASEATTLVTGDPGPALAQLDAMQHVYNLWDDHFDRTRNLYWIEPIADATEYTISSIDASGAGFTDKPDPDPGKNGFLQGFAFRPSINSYQYANALAIAHLAVLAHQPAVASDYRARAERIRAAVLQQLWNPQLQHFTDIYQRSTPTVRAGDFIRGRELVGYTPWMYELPPTTDTAFNAAWQHLLAADELAGPHGLRTVEPSYARYMTQYRYAAPGRPECQWNGPSWPFQTSQVLTAMAYLLQDYPAAAPARADYLRLLRQYAAQHTLLPGTVAPGTLDLQEDYDPDTGKPIVGLARSHHYAHSTYVDLVLTGLLGIRPRADNVLELAPLLPDTADAPHYFFLQHLAYHGHDVSILYDRDGTRYHRGRGISVFVDGRAAVQGAAPGRVQVPLAHAPLPATHHRNDVAVNVGVPDGPIATASSGSEAAQAIDGRMWFFPEIANGWSPALHAESWFAVDLRQSRTVRSVELFFAPGDGTYAAPASVRLQRRDLNAWIDIPASTPALITGGVNTLHFAPTTTSDLRVLFPGSERPMRLIEFEAYE